MFYIQYLWAEVTRRLGKTVSITAGLAVASLIIVVIVSISQGLSRAQKNVLNPLQNVGTDILLSRSVDSSNPGDLDEATRTEMMSENRISTDLSKLGKAGEHFTNDTFLSGTMLTFAATDTDKLKTDTVADYVNGLILNVTHQEGTIPDVVAEVQTGGEDVAVQQSIEPMTDAERQAVDAARTKAEQDLQSQGIDPHSQEGRDKVRAATDAAMPERFKNQTFHFTTPNRTYRQEIGAVSTDIQTTNFTVGGVDTSKTDMGLILPSQITEGSYFTDVNQIVVNRSYADKNGTKVGDTFTLNKKGYTVVGIVDPKLYAYTADFYLPLAELQTLAGKDGRVNIVLIKSANASAVAETSQQIAALFPGAKVTNSEETANEVSGSLMSAANLTSRFITTASIIVVLAAFIIVSLLTVSSINKRTREIGTLKAMGWSNFEVVRQIVIENLALGIAGAILGAGLGVLVIVLLNRFDISLTADIAKQNLSGFVGRFGRGGDSSADNTTAASVELKMAINYLVMLLGAAVAIVGATVSGLVAAWQVSRLKPQVALRNLE